jgi:hypothetical protein
MAVTCEIAGITEMCKLQLVALHACHECHFLSTLDHFWTALLAHDSTVLEEAFVPRKAVTVVTEGHQT